MSQRQGRVGEQTDAEFQTQAFLLCLGEQAQCVSAKLMKFVPSVHTIGLFPYLTVQTRASLTLELRSHHLIFNWKCDKPANTVNPKKIK